MNTTELMAEFVIIGVLALILSFNLFPEILGAISPHISQLDTIAAIIFLVVSYVIGFLVNVLAEAIFSPIYLHIETLWKRAQGSGALVMDSIRYSLYANAQPQVIQRLEYHRALLRLSRSIAFVAGFFLIASIFLMKFYISVGLALLFGSSLLAFYRRIIWFSKTCYSSWLSLCQTNNSSSEPSKRFSPLNTNTVSSSILGKQDKDIRIVTFAGGTGFRQINIALAESGYEITRIVPVWDNGGSSKQLRKALSVMPIGDIRHALMTMAHGEGRVGSVVKLFNSRLAESGTDKELRDELSRLTNGEHSLVQTIEPSLRDVIINYLRVFYQHLPDKTDLSYGSIGNFVLVGAYLSHGNNINTAIYVFRQLCSIQGNVMPVSTRNDLHIGVKLENEEVVVGQERVTNLDRTAHRSRMKRAFFTDCLEKKTPTDKLSVLVNPLVLESMTRANLIVFGPGSFFTSIVPHLMVDGVVDHLADINTSKILIGNMLEHVEGYGYTVTELVKLFLETCVAYAAVERAPTKYLTHVLINDSDQHTDKVIHGTRYLQVGSSLVDLTDKGIQCLRADYEDPWRSGFHDAKLVASVLRNIRL